MTTPIALAAASGGMHEYLDVAVQALGTDGGDDALVSLGFWDLLTHLDDLDTRLAVFALFRAHGRQLAASSALGGLVAQPYLPHTEIPPGRAIATLTRHSARRGTVHVVVGDIHDRHVIVNRPGQGVSIVPPDAVSLRSMVVPGRVVLHAADIDWAAATTIVAESDAEPIRQRSTFLGRVAIAAETLGAAEAAVGLAVEHATNREQFGQPIGKFQAVRHILAQASTACVAIEAVLTQAIVLDDAAPAKFGEVLKALAGRNGRTACERSLQALGGIGFTAEHDHHHHHSRVLALDALLGTSADLTHQLGAWLRSERVDPRFAASMLVPDASPRSSP